MTAQLPGHGRTLDWAKGRQAERFSHSLMSGSDGDVVPLLAESFPLASCLATLYQLTTGADVSPCGLEPWSLAARAALNDQHEPWPVARSVAAG